MNVIEFNISTGETITRPATPDEIAANSPQPPSVPVVVSRFQAKAALLGAGLLDAVEALMANPATPAIARLAWAEALEFRRDSPTLAAMASALALTDEQLDDLFVEAAKVSA